MSVSELLSIIGIESDCNKIIKDIKTDTRLIKSGDVFIALKGKNYDGNDFVYEALSKGAILCITESNVNYDNCVKVNDTYRVMCEIARYMRSKYPIPLIAITGSNGKTTTKDLVAHILNFKYNVLKNVGSKNNLIGVSQTLFNLNNSYDVIVMELGSNHLGEIEFLSTLCSPDYSIITNIGSSHLEYFKNKKNIYKEKLSILHGMKNKKLIVNGDDKFLKKTKSYKCGTKRKNDLKAYNIKEELNKISFNIYLDKEYKITFNNPGVHFVTDILLAIKVCLDFDIKIKHIIKKINSFKITDKRMNYQKVGSNVIIDDCYNSSYESFVAGINYLKNINCNKIIIIGDILELGEYSRKIHRKLDKKLKKIKNKQILTVGKYSKLIKGKSFVSNNELIEYIKKLNITNTYIYIKGSRKTNLDEIVKFLTKKRTI